MEKKKQQKQTQPFIRKIFLFVCFTNKIKLKKPPKRRVQPCGNEYNLDQEAISI